MFFRAPPVPIPDLESKGAIFVKGGNIKSKKSKIRKKRQKWRKTFKKLENFRQFLKRGPILVQILHPTKG